MNISYFFLSQKKRNKKKKEKEKVEETRRTGRGRGGGELSDHLAFNTFAFNSCNKTILFSPVFSFPKISSAETLDYVFLYVLF